MLRKQAMAKRPSVRKKCLPARAMAIRNAINEAIVRSESAGEALHRVCNAAIEQGGFSAAAVYLAGPNRKLKFIAGGGKATELLQSVEISTDEQDVHGQGPSGIAFRTGRSCI